MSGRFFLELLRSEQFALRLIDLFCLTGNCFDSILHSSAKPFHGISHSSFTATCFEKKHTARTS